MSLTIHPPTSVRIISEGHSTFPEPPLDPSWTDLDKLRWHAGVVTARAGVDVKITTGGLSRGGVEVPGYGCWVGRSTIGGGWDFGETWLFIVGLELGAKAKAEATDVRCPETSDTGQCLDHRGHLGGCQYPEPRGRDSPPTSP